MDSELPQAEITPLQNRLGLLLETCYCGPDKCEYCQAIGEALRALQSERAAEPLCGTCGQPWASWNHAEANPEGHAPTNRDDAEIAAVLKLWESYRLSNVAETVPKIDATRTLLERLFAERSQRAATPLEIPSTVGQRSWLASDTTLSTEPIIVLAKTPERAKELGLLFAGFPHPIRIRVGGTQQAFRPEFAEMIRLRKVDAELRSEGTGWTDAAAFLAFNKQMTAAHAAARRALSEIIGEEAVSAIWGDCGDA